MSLKGTSEKYSTNALTHKQRLRVIAGFVILFGITWVFGILVVINDSIPLQYLFCVLSGLQGLYIFLFYCIRNKKVRRFWFGLLRGENIKEMQRASTRKKPKLRKALGGDNRADEPRDSTSTVV